MRPDVPGDEAPFDAGGEARTAAAAQARSLDHVGHFLGFHRGDGFLEGLEPAILLVDIQIIDIGNIPVTQQEMSHYFTSLRAVSMNSMVLSTVIFSW